MVTVEEAQQRARAAVNPARPVQLPLIEALGHFLAEPLLAPRPLPACDNSAMDGYAVRSSDTLGATRDRPVQLRVVGTSAAGARTHLAIAPGEAARVFTGAPIPAGSDSVVRQEATSEPGPEPLSGTVDAVQIFLDSPVGKNIRRQGEELATGSLVAAPGTRANPHVLALAASFGLPELRVRPAPRIAILVSGDELVPPGQAAAEHQVYESNSLLLSGLATSAGAVTVQIALVRDDDAQILDALERAATVADLIVTSGGASVGERDRIKHVLTRAGATWSFDRVALKPGTPVALAAWRERPIFVLPGNPGAATVAFDEFVRPALFRLQGVHEVREVTWVSLGSDLFKQAHLTQLLSARISRDEGELRLWVRPRGAGQIFQNVDAEGWVRLPAGQADFIRGTRVAYEAFQGARYRADP